MKDSFPLPRIEKLLHRLRGARVFSKLDLRDGYHQIIVKEEARDKTAFLCRYGSYEWQVLPMGLCNAPSTFQRITNQVFWDLLDTGVLVYLDDIFIYSRTEADHKKLLEEVFRRLQKYKLYLKAAKCSLFLEKVSFLGHIVSAEGLSVDPTKIDDVGSWPMPRSVKEV